LASSQGARLSREVGDLESLELMLGILNKLGFNTRAWIAAWMASAKPWCNCCGGRSARDYCHVRPVVGAELSR
jgi:hypothetical protein